MTPIQTILCPTDFSQSSRAAVDYAIELAKLLHAKLRLLNVFEPQPLEVDAAAPELSGQVISVIEAESKERLAAEQKRVSATGVEVTSELAVGSPARVIAELSSQVQLIVLSSHGRTGLAHLLMGSVT
ncbi:MAG TPA: universal stress protein, partial [Polyangiales bacterium]|nr:universal stress protein [Polyangiales bacterium]